MLKKLVSLTIAVMMVMALIAVPAMAEDEAVFSEANIKRNYYNLSPNGSNSTLGYDSYEEAAVPAVPHVNASAGTRDSHFRNIWKKASGNAYQSVKYERANSTAGHVSGTEAPRYVHQRIKFVWYDGTNSKVNQLHFGLSTNTSLQTAEIFKINGKDHGDVYFFDWGTASTNRRMMWNAGTPIKVSGKGEEYVNTMDLIINLDDNESNHRGMVYVFFNGELCVYGKSADVEPNAFYGWTLTQEGGDVDDYLEIWQDENLLGHTEYYTANGYVPTFEDVLNHAGLTDAVDEDSNVMMKTSKMRWFMPHGNDKVRIDAAVSNSSATNWLNNDGTMNTVVYNGTQATVSRTPSDSASWEKAANLLAGVYPQTAHGIGYSSYHPQFKYVRFSFDQTIGNGTQLAYRLNDSASATVLKFSDNNGKLKVDLCGVTKTVEVSSFQKNRIDWVIEPDEGADGGTDDDTLTHYLFVNGEPVAACISAPGEQNVRIDDIGLYTKGSNPSVVYDNWSMTLYNNNATFEDIGMEALSPEEGVVVEIPAPKHENVKVLFEEDFEGETADSLSDTYPRTYRVNDGICLSYWGIWDDDALTDGFDSETGIFACAGIGSNSSRTFEVYIPTDVSPQKGLVNVKFNIKPQASLSRQELTIFRSDNYAAADDVKNGVLIFDNSNISRYIGKWLEVNIWVDLDNNTYQYNIYDTASGKVVNQGEGTQKFNNLGGFAIKLKGSDSQKDYSELAPAIDNIYFASAEKPDENAFKIKTFSLNGANANINFEIGENVSKNADIYMALYDGTNKFLKSSVSKKPITLDATTKTATASVENSNAADGDIYRLFIWEKDTLKPLFLDIDSYRKVYPSKIKDNADFHTPTMRAYLADAVENCKTYADGTVAAEEPMPITFEWAGDENCSYVLKVSENSDMSSPWVFKTDETSYDVYNLKIATRYYWTVEAVENSQTVYTTDVQTFTTIDAAPRNLLIGGSVRNVRDIGGWKTADGKRVKQGLIFRSSALDTWDSDMDRPNLLVSKGGIETMTKLLGIKTEIDFRQDDPDDSFPTGKSTSILGENVAYYHCPMDYGDYLTRNFDSIRNIFEILADADNYPITYHCAVGADRTGAITYLINGLLGVSKEDLKRDYSMTNFSYQSKYRGPVTDGYVAILDNYTGSTLQEKIYNYLANEVGVPTANLDFIINYMTE